MNKKEAELLEKFIDKDLIPEEQNSIWQLINSSDELKKELQLRMDINTAIMEKKIMKLRETLKIIHKKVEHQKTGTVRRLITKNWHLAAASITILFILGSFLLSNINSASLNHIYNKYYKIEDAIYTNRSADDAHNPLIIALSKFQNNEYEQAINLLFPIKNSHMAQYYLGLSYMETEQFSAAKNLFQKIIDQKNNIFLEQAKWYKALCLLKLGDKVGAVKLFENLIEDDNLHSGNATDILKALK